VTAKIVPGGNNTVAIDLITTHIRRQLSERSLRLRTELSKTPAPLSNAVSETSYFGLPPNVVLMEQTPQLKVVVSIQSLSEARLTFD
jgi:uridine kinase